MRPGRRPGRARTPGGWVIRVLVVVALAAGGCLPTNVRPSSPAASASPSPVASPSSTAAPTATPAATATPSPGSRFVVHAVAPGETLLGIARRYGTSGRSIAFWNRDTYPSLDPDSADYAPDRIEVGWQLRLIPGEEFVPPDATPTPPVTPQPSLVIPPAPTPGVDTSVVVSNGPRGGNAVALTFDIGGRLDPALAIMDWLVANGVQATIFPTGATASGTAIGREVMARIAAHPDLFAVGNHTWDHPDITTLDAGEIADQLERTEAALESATGRSSKPLFRPPFGAHDRASRDAVGAAGWGFTVMWDVDTIDWKPEADGGPTTSDIVGRVLSRAQGGSIVLLHLGGYNTLDALPGIVDGLRGRGLEPVTLPRLLGIS